jgi:uncharacterized membrane protein YeiH
MNLNPDILNQYTYFLSLIAVAALSASGVIQAARSGLDPFGGLVLAMVAAVGGGTLRDLFLGATPVFWITDLIHLAVLLPVALITMFLIGRIRSGKGRRLKVLLWVDAIGLALFTVLGTQKALSLGTSSEVAVIMGVVTGVFGGVIRDLLCQERPAVLQDGELYASCAIIAAIIYTQLIGITGEEIATLVSLFTAFFLRSAAILFGLKLPSLPALGPKHDS